MEQLISMKANVVLERRDKTTGKVLDHEELHNLFVNTGKQRVARLICGNSGSTPTTFKYVAIGTSATAAAATDTALGTEVDRAIADSSGGAYEADYKAIWEKTFTFDSGESYSVVEACISDSAVASGQTILNRFTFTGKSVDSDTDLYIKVTYTIS